MSLDDPGPHVGRGHADSHPCLVAGVSDHDAREDSPVGVQDGQVDLVGRRGVAAGALKIWSSLNFTVQYSLGSIGKSCKESKP